ncbi:hypothetical protein OPT61_g4706 [Boeremia exigua]|uniref:Uncharacterized protein n=1 Tax=Boeremia exigua TaxID=749465 RepID=A0ACC2ID57_9PLEO|nr:hypothetical protein OPT61_g4706 [Boeremia exigua]
MAIATLLSSTGLSVLLLALSSNIVTSSAMPSPNGITDILLPTPNITGGPVAEIQCYALPYGAVGVVSHLLTSWTIVWMAYGMIPIWPGHKIKHWKFDLFLALLALCTCIPVASITIHRCRLSWHFVLISIWKLVTSVTLACISIHRCILVRRSHKAQEQGAHHRLQNLDEDTSYRLYAGRTNRVFDHHNNNPQWRDNTHDGQGGRSRPKPSRTGQGKDNAPLWWLLLYLAGTIVGMVGLCSLLWTAFRDNKTVKHLTYGFAAPMAIIPLMVSIHWFIRHLERPDGGLRTLLSAYLKTFGCALVAFAAVFGFFSALYADLVLGAIADNLLGLPSADYAPLYWIWFFAKRLTLLSF